jgi:micrococcal nuclease
VLTAVELLERAGRAVTDGGVEAWLVGAGVVALYLAYRAVKLVVRLAALGVAALTFLVGAPAGDLLPGIDLPGRDAVATTDVAVPDGAFRAVVTSVTDGDSLRARVTDPGSTAAGAGEELELRLLRIDAPERARDGRPADCLADEATAALTVLAGPGAEVAGVHDTERRDRYDRDLVHLWTPDGRWVNGALLTAGLAQVVTFPPNTAFDTEVRDAEAEARREGRGLWDPAAC